MSWLSEELSGWPIGSGYYSTSVGTDEAKDMARAIEEALLADDVIERAARAFYEAGNDVRHESHLLSWDRLVEASPAVANGYRDHMRAALVAAIEGGE